MTKKVSVKKATKKVAKKAAKKAAKKSTKKVAISRRMAEAKKDASRARMSVSKRGEKLFKEAVKDIFKRFKGLDRFSWPQYTPHWNDGDECSFGVCAESVTVNNERGDSQFDDFWSLKHAYGLLSKKKKEEARILQELKDEKDQWKVDSLKRDLEILKTRSLEDVEEKYKIKKAIVDVLENIDESAFESMFGEGLVVVTREGSHVEEYEHE
jgi:hypothetical protein